MPTDLKISELVALDNADSSTGDLLAIVNAHITKKVTLKDLILNGYSFQTDDSLSSEKILFEDKDVPGAALADLGITAAKIANDAVIGRVIADDTIVKIAANALSAGEYNGQLGIANASQPGKLKIQVYNQGNWQDIAASASINEIEGLSGDANITTGAGKGIVDIVAEVDSEQSDKVIISAVLRSAGKSHVLVAPSNDEGGFPTMRPLAGADLPIATSSAIGGVKVAGNGLIVDETGQIKINSQVGSSSDQLSVVTYDSNGLITSGRAVTGNDLPNAEPNVPGVVKPGSGLQVVSGALGHINVNKAQQDLLKVTVDDQGHVISGVTTLETADLPDEIPASSLVVQNSAYLPPAVINSNSITGDKLSDFSTLVEATSDGQGGVTFPDGQFRGQLLLDQLNNILYYWTGTVWKSVIKIDGLLVFAGTIQANGVVTSNTDAGRIANIIQGNQLPAPSASNQNMYVMVNIKGSTAAPLPTPLQVFPPDLFISVKNGQSQHVWQHIQSADGQDSTNASSISIAANPGGLVEAGNVQQAIFKLDDDKANLNSPIFTNVVRLAKDTDIKYQHNTDNSAPKFSILEFSDNSGNDKKYTLPTTSSDCDIVITGKANQVSDTELKNGLTSLKFADILDFGGPSTKEFTNTTITVDKKGFITAIADGTAPTVSGDVFKANANTFTNTNTFEGSEVGLIADTTVEFLKNTKTKFEEPTSSGSYTLSLKTADYFKLAVNGNVSIDFSNFPTSGDFVSSFVLDFDVSSSGSITFVKTVSIQGFTQMPALESGKRHLMVFIKDTNDNTFRATLIQGFAG